MRGTKGYYSGADATQDMINDQINTIRDAFDARKPKVPMGGERAEIKAKVKKKLEEEDGHIRRPNRKKRPRQRYVG